MRMLGSEGDDGGPPGFREMTCDPPNPDTPLPTPDFICMQEHKYQSSAACTQGAKEMRVCGFRGTFSVAGSGPQGGASGGTCTLARNHIPLSEVDMPHDHNGNTIPLPGMAEGRASVALVRGGPRKALVVLSTYLYTGEGPGGKIASC